MDKICKILVIGDLILDEFKWGVCEKISPEAPVPVVNITNESVMLGGAGNVIKNLVDLKVEVSVVGVIGDDEAGILIRKLLDEMSVKSFLVIEKGRLTSKKTRVIASRQQIVSYDKESVFNVTENSGKKLLASVEEAIIDIDVILISDYAKGLLTTEFVQTIIRLGNQRNIKTIIDPKGNDYSKYKDAFLLKPNRKEAGIAGGEIITSEETLKKVGFRLREQLRLQNLVITLSEDGMSIFSDTYKKIPTKAQTIFDVSGAGDTVLACIGYCLANNYSIEDACDFANHAAAIVVGKVGTASASLEEIQKHMKLSSNGNDN